MASVTALSWPIVGRGEELAFIERARAATTSAVVLLGPAGVGKSRLAREALRRGEDEGLVARWVQATRSAATVPLGAFAGIIPDGARSEDPLELLQLSATALRELGGARPLMLGIDDAQLLDDSSAALVLELTLSEAAFVVATVRTGEPVPDAIVSVWKDAGAARLELETLGAEETDALAEAIVGGPIEESALRWIYATSLGNPLYVRELTLGALAGGALTNVHGLWRMPARPSVSASLAELIAVRMTGLSHAEQRALELLALGEPLRVAELVSLIGAEPVAGIEARGLASLGDGSLSAQATLAHPLYGETIRGALPAFAARQTRVALADTVAGRRDPEPGDSLRIARWLLEAGEPIPTSTLLQAAAAANVAGDPQLGVRLARRAVDAGGGLRASLLLARAHTIQSEYEQAAEVLAAAEPDIDSEADAVDYLEQQTAVLYFGLRRSEELHRLLDRAHAWWDSPEWHDRLSPLRLVGDDDTPPNLAAAASAEILADENVDPEVRRRVAPLHAANLLNSGSARDAFELARQIRPSLPLRDLTDEIAFVLWSAIAIESGLGWSELETWATAALTDGVRLGSRAAAGRGALALAGLRFSQGRFIESGRWLAEAELQLEQHDAGGLLAITNSMQVGVACFTGDHDAVGPALARCRAAVGDHVPLSNQLPYFARAEAWAVLADGDTHRAQQLFLEAAGRLRERPLYAARLTYEALRAGTPARRVARDLEALAQRCDAPLTAAYAAHATARVADDGDALMAVVDAMEAIGALRYATEIAADAAGAFHRAGYQDSARRAAARCRELHARGQGGALPAIVGLDDAATSLTSRERQLVDLASRGLTNAEIADRLVLSVRTVESHLYHAMQKLGVSNRQDL
jgi:DNA-binding CsgD family transcriptional regulator